MLKNDLNTRLKVWYSTYGLNSGLCSLLFRPLDDQSTHDHLNTKLVCYSDPHDTNRIKLFWMIWALSRFINLTWIMRCFLHPGKTLKLCRCPVVVSARSLSLKHHGEVCRHFHQWVRCKLELFGQKFWLTKKASQLALSQLLANWRLSSKNYDWRIRKVCLTSSMRESWKRWITWIEICVARLRGCLIAEHWSLRLPELQSHRFGSTTTTSSWIQDNKTWAQTSQSLKDGSRFVTPSSTSAKDGVRDRMRISRTLRDSRTRMTTLSKWTTKLVGSLRSGNQDKVCFCLMSSKVAPLKRPCAERLPWSMPSVWTTWPTVRGEHSSARHQEDRSPSSAPPSCSKPTRCFSSQMLSSWGLKIWGSEIEKKVCQKLPISSYEVS